MKINLLLLSLALISFFACNKGSDSGTAGSGTSELVAEIDSFSYAIGANIGESIKQGYVNELNMEAFKVGLLAAMGGDSVSISEEEARKIIESHFQKLYVEKSESNKKEGEEFLAQNKTKEGVKVTESGIQYTVLKEGSGPIPADSNVVRVHYHGTLTDGTVFDSSVDRGEPAEFPVKGVIKGWQEILQLMPVGSKWKVFIPTDLAYGANPRRGGKIGPNMPLVFEMELLEIVDPAKQQQEREEMMKKQEELRKQQQNN